MTRPKRQFPEPTLRKRGKRYQVIWWVTGPGANGKTGRYFGAATGAKDEARAEVCRLEVAMALRTGRWPAWTKDAPGVRTYLAGYAGTSEPAPIVADMQAGDILAAYEPYLAAGRARRYAITCLAHLRELRDFAKKPLEAITAADAEAFLTHILMTPGQQRKANGRRTAGTRNRALAACSGFYKWGVRIGRLPQNPFAGQHSIREPQLPEIIYLSREERGGVLEEAQLLPDGVAAWLALYAGLRRSEIIRAAWSDVLWDTARLVVPRAKTGERRVVPLQTTLLTRLRELRPAAGKGPVVPWPENMAKAEARAEHLLDRLRKACAGVPARRISWNSFRHSFASALAQAGVSLDKISAWMGNSPAVCRRHYAEFVPRDARDAEIDLL